MTRIPPAVLILGFAGLIPFVWGALLVLQLFEGLSAQLPAMFEGDGRILMVRYGGIILPLLSGTLWGFAVQTGGTRGAIACLLAVLPALWWFFMPGSGAISALTNLGVGFVALLLLDFFFARWELAPRWWMSLRLQLTIVVLVCLTIGVVG